MEFPSTATRPDAVRLTDTLWQNYALIQEFTNSAGQIKPSMTTRLRPVNQRKIAKMVRRAQGLGLYSTIHAHPELIRSDFFPFSN